MHKRISVTSIVVTHDRDLAFDVSDRIAVLVDGKLLAIGTVDEVKRNPNPTIQKFLHADFKNNQPN